MQRFATAAAPAYLDRCGRPGHPRDLLTHACLRGRFASGAMASPWEFERAGEVVRLEPQGPLVVSVGAGTDLAVDMAVAGVGAGTDLAVDMAVAGVGVIHLLEDWLRPRLDSGTLEPVLHEWWQPFSGPFLYYSGRRLVPPPLRAFLDFVNRLSSKAV